MKGEKLLKKPYIKVPSGWELVKSIGPGPFVTKARYLTSKGNTVLWNSRHHRKQYLRLNFSYGYTWWAPTAISWWIGILFAIGAFCFALASIPSYANFTGVLGDDVTYFLGSIFFTAAGLLQYLEVVSTPHTFGGNIKEKIRFIFFEPRRIDWWSASIQSLGTVFFNISTFYTMFAQSVAQIDSYVWSPDIYGSICFLIASYLAYAEAGHSFLSFNIRSLSWWIALINIVGSVAFAASAIGATPTNGSQSMDPIMVMWGTFIGAVCFFTAAILLLPERTLSNNESKLNLKK